MRHKKGVNLVGAADVTGASSRQIESGHSYVVEIWTAPPEKNGSLIETINRSTNFAVSLAARNAAIRERPGKYVLHINGRHRMSCELAPDPPQNSTLSDPPADPPPAQFQQSVEDRLRLSDLAQWYLLAGTCQKCMHVGWIDRWEIARKFGKDTILVTLFPKLKCIRCGNKTGNRIKLGAMKR